MTSVEEEEEDIWPAYLTWIQKFFAFWSILCSFAICREIIADLRNKRNCRSNNASPRVPKQTGSSLQSSIGRILINLSIADMIFSFAVFLGEWPAPKDTMYIHHARGNVGFCTFQGWLRAVGYLASPMFSIALNGFFLLLVRYRWRDQQLWRLEYKVTAGIWLYCLAWSIVPIPLQAYNSDWDVCWVVSAPLDCIDDCTRGLGAMYLEIYFTFIHIWVCLVSTIVLMIILVRTVKSIEDKASKYNHHPNCKVTAARSGKNTIKGETTVPFSLNQPTNNKGKMPPQNCSQLEYDSSSEHSEEYIASNHVERNNNDINCDEASNRQDEEEGIKSDPENDSEGGHTNEALGLAKKKMSSGRRMMGGISIKYLVGGSRNHRSPSLQKAKRHRRARIVSRQCILYTLAFLSTHMLDMIASVIYIVDPGVWYFRFDIFAYMVFQPALGILNFLIFSRNRYTMATPEGRFLRAIFYCCGAKKACSTWYRQKQESE